MNERGKRRFQSLWEPGRHPRDYQFVCDTVLPRFLRFFS
jgi:hypothetical protein